MANLRPPRFAHKVLSWYCSERYFEEIEGDLEELFLEESENGRFQASLRYTHRVLSFIRPRYIRKTQNTVRITMLFNYLLIGQRNLLKYKTYSLFSLLCLILGLSTSLLMMAYVMDELSYDRFLPDHDRIYRVAQHVDLQSGDLDATVSPGPLGSRLQSEMPWVQKHATISIFNRFTFDVDGTKYNEPHAHFVSEGFLEVFRYPLLAGSYENIFQKPKSVLISESLASTLFDDLDVVGRDLEVVDRGRYTVTGVMKDVPANSHFHPRALLFDGPGEMSQYGWRDHSFYNYLLLDQPRTPEAMEGALAGFYEDVLSQPIEESFSGTGYIYLQPLTDIHLHSNLSFELESNGDFNDVLSLSGLALFIIVVVCINYLNITSAQATRRIREIGVRKVLGSSRLMIAVQFYIESLMLCLLAGILGLALAWGLLPYFNYVSGKIFDHNALLSLELVRIYLGIILLLALVSGSYAALFLSGFNIENALRKKVSLNQLKLPVSKVLNAFQFVVSLVMIILTIAVVKQMEYARNRDLGFDQAQVLRIELTNRMGSERMASIASELENHHEISAVAVSMRSPGDDFWADGLFFEQPDGSFTSLKTEFNAVDKQFVETLTLQILEGRDFGLEVSDAEGRAVLVNEQLVKDLGYTNYREIIGKHVKLPLGEDHRAKIIGVTADAHMRSLHHRVVPQILVNFPPIATQLLVKLDAPPSPKILGFIDEKVEEFTQGTSYEVAFLDQHYWEQYEGEQRRSALFSIFSILTVTLAFAGLTALISFQARLQAKSITLRKVFGAGFKDIVGNLLKAYAWQVGLGLILALPLALFLVDQWLSNYAYRVELPYAAMIGAGLALVLGVLSVVALHARSSLRTNPATYLGEE